MLAPGSISARLTSKNMKIKGKIAKQFVECLENVRCFLRQIKIVNQIINNGIANSHFINPRLLQLVFSPFNFMLLNRKKDLIIHCTNN